MYDKLKKANSSVVDGYSKDEWRRKDINDCILDGVDPECQFQTGTEADLSTVSTTKNTTKEGFLKICEYFSLIFVAKIQNA